MRLIHFTLALTFALLIFATWRQCTLAPERPALPCFYFWKTEMRFDSAEWRRLARISGQQPLYVRFFDVDYSGGYRNAVPLGDLSVDGTVSDGRPIVPTVYITNRVFEQLSDSLAEQLAARVHHRIVQKIQDRASDLGWLLLPHRETTYDTDRALRDSLRADWLNRCNEIQLDCDWTAATRHRYFRFLRAFRTLSAPRRVSCTVRLHQYRDRDRAGIPPVDYAMLMCYNVADPRKPATDDAIFDPALVRGYLKAPRYPLPMDVALPMFSWGAWFREEKFQGLLAGWTEKNLSDTTFCAAEAAGRWRIRRDTVIGRDYLRAGDLVRLDAPSEADLLAVTDLLRKRVRSRDSRLVFFDWQTEKIAQYEKIVAACAARFE